MKNKTLAAWLAFLGGPLGLHRFYLHGLGDLLGWLLPIPTALGLYGWVRMAYVGQNDPLAWVLVPVLGFVIAGCCLTAIVYGLTSREKWNARFGADEQAEQGATSWLTVFAVGLALMVGATGLMSSFAMTFQHYFEEGRKISE
ncbi:MAG TPA: hypothetical protein VEA35_05750 [Ramlibacter sp.]|nr:hypothetical protein [Ramlibacter sp.]